MAQFALQDLLEAASTTKETYNERKRREAQERKARDPAAFRANQRERDKRYLERHPERVQEKWRNDYARKKEIDPVKVSVLALARAKRFRERNEQAGAEAQKRYRDSHLGLAAAQRRFRDEYVARATPSWANVEVIQLMYEFAAELSLYAREKFHVDHVIPLRGKYVSGLHVETNLRIIPAHENLCKGNSFSEEN